MADRETNIQRQIIRSARYQYSPVTQNVRERSIDLLVEQCLLLSGEEGATIRELVESSSVRTDEGLVFLRSLDVQNSLLRLVEAGRITATESATKTQYCLSPQAMEELWAKQKESESRLKRVTERLFSHRYPDWGPVLGPFVECLGLIFASLSQTYVQVLRGDISVRTLASKQEIKTACSRIARAYRIAKPQHLLNAVTEFFLQDDPDSVTIKWNMAQNYYVALSLGMDPSGTLLSEEMFGDCTFYLDTNVIIHGIEPQARHYRSFTALVEASRRLGIQLVVSTATLDELSRVVNHYISIVGRVAQVVPPETSNKVRGIFYKLYHEKLKDTPQQEIDLGSLYQNFIDARNILVDEYGVTVDEEAWWDEHAEDADILRDAEAIKAEYVQKNHRPKGDLSAIHDIMLLRRVSTDNGKGGRFMVVTLDILLPEFRIGTPVKTKRRLALTLDALLQWISPFASSAATQDQFPTIFSQALQYQLLPENTFFDLNDFLIFAEIDWDTKSLPGEDVENCILHLKKVAPELDPSDPADREKLHTVIGKFFADPGRKHKAIVAQLEDELLTSEESIHALEEQLKERECQVESLRGQEQLRTLRRSALKRLFSVIILFILLTAGYILGALHWGEGINWFQKLLRSLPFFAIVCGATVGAYFLIVGKRRKYLKASIRRVFRDESD